ncbi:MAG: aldo/keto reductase [Candidatus Diapherotrites archaeon]|nr:aldo/keto reductase [Candidatus Diapherotrites archaeon]
MQKHVFSDGPRINSGQRMPWLGLGVWQSGSQTQEAATTALQAGYRHIDTAKIYGNEKEVGMAVRNSSVDRKEIFVTTKLWNDDHGFESAQKAFHKSLKELGLEYLDLYLIHWPVSGKRKESWKALEKLHREGLIRSIGVSNYTITHLEEMKSYYEIPPAVNQVEFNPFLYQKELHEYCQKNKIQLEAYCPLSRAKRLSDPRLTTLATQYRRTPAQLLLRWALEHEVIVIPKSVHAERIKENSRIFDFRISAADMKEMDSWNENFRVSWNPNQLQFR